MSKKVAIIGFGELGKQFHQFLSSKKGSTFTFFDDHLSKSGKAGAFLFNEYLNEKHKGCSFYVALGYHHLTKKKAIILELLKNKRKVGSFIHPSCFINATATVGEGSFVYPMCNIDKEVVIGKGVLLNNSVCMSHNTTVGDGSYLSPGVVISGNVSIGSATFIGSGSIISNNVRIGKNVIIGAGSLITKDIPDNASVIGNPAKILSRPLVVQ